MQELTKKLNALCDEQPFTTCWYVKDLNTGQEADHDGDTVLPSGSTRKISIMMTAMKKCADGEISLDDPFVVEEKYQNRAKIQQGGTFQYLRPGFTVTLFDAITMMITISDNTCTGKIVDILGVDAINEFCQSVGMAGTKHIYGADSERRLDPNHGLESANLTTPHDVGMLLDKIQAGARDPEAAKALFTTQELCQTAVDIMKRQVLRGRLPQFLPMEAKVASKGGTGRRSANDAGVVYKGEEPQFVISVYTDGVLKEDRAGPAGQTAAAAHLGRLCRTCWDELVTS